MSLYVKKSSINGRGLYTDKSYKKNERIAVITGNIEVVRKFTGKSVQDSLNWIGVSKYSWINTDQSLFRYINHSCEPNTYITGRRTVRACREINAHEELTMDYSLTEPDPEYTMPKPCFCGSRYCRKIIGSINTLPKKDFLRKKMYITNTFKQYFAQN